MNRITPKEREIARLLLAARGRTAHQPADEASMPPTSEAIEALQIIQNHMADLIGERGFRALFERALTLAKEEVPWLEAATPDSELIFEHLDELSTQMDRDIFHEGEVILLANLIELLVVFIGPKLTLKLLSEDWPQLPIPEMDPEEIVPPPNGRRETNSFST